MSNDYFVILNHPNGSYMPMTTGENGDLATFASEEEAVAAGSDNPLGAEYGFEVFERGTGTTK